MWPWKSGERLCPRQSECVENTENRPVPSWRKQFIIIFIIILILRKHARVNTESSNLSLETYTPIVTVFLLSNNYLKNQIGIGSIVDLERLNSVLSFTPPFSVVKTKGQHYKEQTKITDHYQDLGQNCTVCSFLESLTKVRKK